MQGVHRGGAVNLSYQDLDMNFLYLSCNWLYTNLFILDEIFSCDNQLSLTDYMLINQLSLIDDISMNYFSIFKISYLDLGIFIGRYQA